MRRVAQRSQSSQKTSLDDAQVSRYLLHVVSPNTRDTVRGAGGLIFDKVMSGWDVVVLAPAGCDARPMQILGVTVHDVDDGAYLDTPSALIAAACSDTSGEAMSPMVRSALADGRIEVALWGTASLDSMHPSLTTDRYTISAAARAYKKQALMAAHLSVESMPSIEAFRTLRAPRPQTAGLMGAPGALTEPVIARSSS